MAAFAVADRPLEEAAIMSGFRGKAMARMIDDCSFCQQHGRLDPHARMPSLDGIALAASEGRWHNPRPF
jgi:hypothetical protein